MEGVFSYDVFQEMMRKAVEPSKYATPSPNPLTSPVRTYAGVQISPNPAFPFEQPCGKCSGTGEGVESTYCQKCSGAGNIRYEGVMRNGSQTIILTGNLPRAFEPSFPANLVPLPRLSRGLA